MRQTRFTKIVDKIPTEDQQKHNTIAASRKPGVIKGRTVLYPEFVDVYVCESGSIQNKSETKGLSGEFSEGKESWDNPNEGSPESVVYKESDTLPVAEEPIRSEQ